MLFKSTLVSLSTLVVLVSAAAKPPTAQKGSQKAATGTAAASSSTSAAAAASAGNAGGDAQSSTTLDPKVIASGFANNGQDVPTAGQVASLTSTNNFINFCLTVPNLPITNGQQITTGSCNPAPMGIIPSTSNMPSAKFINPPNFGTIQASQTFDVQMNIQGMETGFFVNAKENYFAAPQQLNAQGQIQGHSHVTIEKLDSLTQTTPLNSKNYIFFKGLNDAAVNGVLTAEVTGGLASGFYRLASINTAANHQPALVPIAQHGSLDDWVYFTVTDDGKPLADSGAASSSAAASASSSAAASSVAASASKATATAAATRKIASRPSKATVTAAAVASKSAAATGQKAAPAAASSKAAATGKAAGAALTKNTSNGKTPQASSQKAGSQGSKTAASSAAAAKKGQGRTRRAVNRLIQA